MCFTLFPPVPWGLSRIGARSEGTANGTGVTVYTIDTGIDVDHVEFRKHGNAYASYTARGLKHTGDVDNDGHGTHVGAIVAGQNIGVAPGAEVHAVKACDIGGLCTLADLIDSLVWVCKLEHRHLQAVTGQSRPKVSHGHCCSTQ